EGTTVESVRGSLKRSRRALRAAYTRLADSSPVVVVLAGLRGLGRRVSDQAQRTHMAVAVSGLGDRAVNAVAVAVAVGLGASGGGIVSPRPPLSAAAAAAASPKPPGGSGTAVPATMAHQRGSRALSNGAGAAGRAAAPAGAQQATPTPPDNGLRVPGS